MESAVCRRDFSLGFAAGAFVTLATPKDSLAFSLGTSGPKEWLKEQKKRTAGFILKPIARSREYLTNAFRILSASSDDDQARAVDLLRFAASDCIPFETGSLLDLQTRTGVEVCTFRLLVKNAASLLDDDDPAKVNAYLALDSLVRSFQVLDEYVEQGSATRSTIDDAFDGTYKALDEFEAGIRACLGIA